MRNKRYFLTSKPRGNYIYCPKADQNVQINKACHKGFGSKKEDACKFFNGGGHDGKGHNYLWCNYGEGDSNCPEQLLLM